MDTNTTATVFGRLNYTTWRNPTGSESITVAASLYDTVNDTTVDLAEYTTPLGDTEAFDTSLNNARGDLAPYCDTIHPRWWGCRDGYFSWEGTTLAGYPINETWTGVSIDDIAAHHRSKP